MNKEDVKRAMELAKAYKSQIEAGHKDSKEFDTFWEFIKERTDDVYARSITFSILYDGGEMGLSEEQITLMLKVAGIVTKGEKNV